MSNGNTAGLHPADADSTSVSSTEPKAPYRAVLYSADDLSVEMNIPRVADRIYRRLRDLKPTVNYVDLDKAPFPQVRIYDYRGERDGFLIYREVLEKTET